MTKHTEAEWEEEMDCNHDTEGICIACGEQAVQEPVTPEQMLERIAEENYDDIKIGHSILLVDPNKLALVLAELFNRR